VAQVVDLDLGGDSERRVVHRALSESVRVVGDHGVILRQQVGQRAERGAGHGLTDDQQERAGAADLVVELAAWNGQVVGGGRCRHGDLRVE
jgi:hypothetical protein